MFSGSSTNNPPLRCHVCRSKGMFKGMEDFNFGKPIKGFEDIVLCADGSEDQSCPGKSLKEKQHKINEIVQGLGYRPVTFSESRVSYCVCVKITNMTSKRVIQRALVPASKHPFCQTQNCNKRDFQPKWKGCWMKGNIFALDLSICPQSYTDISQKTQDLKTSATRTVRQIFATMD